MYMFIFCAMYVYELIEILWSSIYHGKWLEWIKILNLLCQNPDTVALWILNTWLIGTEAVLTKNENKMNRANRNKVSI